MNNSIPLTLRILKVGRQAIVILKNGTVLDGVVEEISADGVILRRTNGDVEAVAETAVERVSVKAEVSGAGSEDKPIPTTPPLNPDADFNVDSKSFESELGSAETHETTYGFTYNFSGSLTEMIRLSPPSILVDDVGEMVREQLVRLQNACDYAFKIKEPQRLRGHVEAIIRLASGLENPKVLRGAAQWAFVSGDVQNAKKILARIARGGDLNSLIVLASIAIATGDYVLALLALEGRIQNLGSRATDVDRKAKDRIQLEVGDDTLSNNPKLRLDQRLLELITDKEQKGGEVRIPMSRALGEVIAFNSRRNSGQIYQLPSGPHHIFFADDISDDRIRTSLREGILRMRVQFQSTVDLERKGYLRASKIVQASQNSQSITQAVQPTESLRKHSGYSGTTYQKATRANHGGNLELARKLYEQEIAQNGPKAKSAIKDLMMLQMRLGSFGEVREIAKRYAGLFTSEEMIPVDQIRLQNAVKAKEHQEAREIIAGLLNRVSPQQRVTLQQQDAFCLASLGQFDQAVRTLDVILKRYPGDPTTVNVLRRIQEIKLLGAEDRSSELQDEAERFVLAGGLSGAAIYYLDACEFIGVDERSRQEDTYGAKDFRAVNSILTTLRGRRPKEKASYNLTLAAILRRDPEADETRDISDLMARHFSYRAEFALMQAEPADTIRFFLVEAMYHSPSKPNRREIIDLLRTYGLVEPEGDSSDDVKNLDRAIQKLSSAIESEVLDERFVRHCPYYCSRLPLFENFVLQLQVSENMRNSLTRYSSELRDSQTIKYTLDEMRRGPLSEVRARHNSESALSLVDMCVFELDRERLEKLSRLSSDAAQFIGERNYRSKLVAHGRLITGLESLHAEILNKPTLLSLESIRLVVDWTREEVEKIQQVFLGDTRPEITVENVLREDQYEMNSGSTIVTLNLHSSLGGAPVTDVVVEVHSRDDREAEKIALPNVFEPGMGREIRVDIEPSESQITDEAFDVEVYVDYVRDSGEKGRAGPFSVPVRLNRGLVFEEIPNPYKQYSGGTTVSESKMFFGREDLILDMEDQVCSGPLGQCFVLYGQKRSGKSSVLAQVRSRIDPKHLLIYFSMGEIGTRNSEDQFSRRIVEELNYQLEQRGGHELISFESDNQLEYHERTRLALRLAKERIEAENKGGRLIVMIDEFTYLWEYIREGTVSGSFMRFWKALLEMRLFSAVLVGQDSMPGFKREFPNEFGVTKDVRISYLKPNEAEALIDQPVLYNGMTRCRGSAKSDLLRLTAGSPYFLQIVCDRLVRLANRRRTRFITGADVEEIVQELTLGQSQLSLDVFDPLVTAAGEQVGIAPRAQFMKLLTEIAHKGSAHTRDFIGNEALIADLIDRDVLVRSADGTVNLTVGLFEEWLKVNRLPEFVL